MPDAITTESDRPERRAAVVLAGHQGDAVTARAALSDPDGTVRAAALSALLRCAAITRDDLAAGVEDPDPVVRRRAVELVPRSVAADVAAPDLVALLPDPDDRVTEMACFAAGEIESPTPDVVAAVVSLATGHADALCREAAVAAIGSWGAEEGRAAVLAACHDKAPVRRRAVLALAQFDGPDVDAALTRLTGDRDLQVRQSAEDLVDILHGHDIG